ncbi:MAG: hypothetical protein H8E60_08965 [Candidatus Marinimicrobia bacterium]|nr:hypothetical protein [Candidatus Neomarinimicrobiota bacterium]
MMLIELKQIANARSGDKGPSSNVGILFKNKEIYQWAKRNITVELIKNHFKSIAKGEIIRYELDNIFALNFILGDSLGGGGSETLINDAQGKTHGQAMLLLKLDVPNHLI